jgi:ABC-2 type transport system permease protein
MSLTYARYELVRLLRNRQFLAFALGFPVVLFFLLAGPQQGDRDFLHSGISAPSYYMIGMVAFGTMAGMLSSGARIAAERTVGWNRQLRLTPLGPVAYFRVKVATGYVTSILTVAVLYLCGAALGVSIAGGRWLEMTGLILLGLLPFAALGILLGHLLKSDTIGPALGGSISLLAFLGGAWFPISNHGILHDVAQFIPSYWLIRASHIAVGAPAWSAEGWAVMAVWTLGCAAAAGWAYRRDTGRV